MDLAAILTHLYPDLAGWSIVDNEIKEWPEGVATPTQEELETGWQKVQAEHQIEAEAEMLQDLSDDSVRSIPGWAKWKEQEALNYIEQSVTDLKSAKVVLMAMARMILALRNKTFPNVVVEDE